MPPASARRAWGLVPAEARLFLAAAGVREHVRRARALDVGPGAVREPKVPVAAEGPGVVVEPLGEIVVEEPEALDDLPARTERSRLHRRS